MWLVRAEAQDQFATAVLVNHPQHFSAKVVDFVFWHVDVFQVHAKHVVSGRNLNVVVGAFHEGILAEADVGTKFMRVFGPSRTTSLPYTGGTPTLNAYFLSSISLR